jgi:hypothetical protein
MVFYSATVSVERLFLTTEMDRVGWAAPTISDADKTEADA